MEDGDQEIFSAYLCGYLDYGIQSKTLEASFAYALGLHYRQQQMQPASRREVERLTVNSCVRAEG